MPSNTQNVKMGVCQISFGGEDLGYTKGGVEVTVSTQTKPMEVDQFGNSPINELITGRTCKVKVPLAETTLANLVRIMPGASLVETGGTAATGTITFLTAPPISGDTITVNGVVFTFETTPAVDNNSQLAIPATFTAAATAVAAAINAEENPLVSGWVTATVSAGIVTVTANNVGTFGNAVTLAKNLVTSADCTVSGATLTGGVNATSLTVQVPSAVGTSLFALAQQLVIHPSENAEEDRSGDFVIPLAMTPGAMSYAYKLDQERIFDCEFQAYPNSTTGLLFQVGSH